jgi:hypothetical protein
MDINQQDLALTLGNLHLQLLDLQGKNAKLQAELDAFQSQEPVNSAQTN